VFDGAFFESSIGVSASPAVVLVWVLLAVGLPDEANADGRPFERMSSIAAKGSTSAVVASAGDASSDNDTPTIGTKDPSRNTDRLDRPTVSPAMEQAVSI